MTRDDDDDRSRDGGEERGRILRFPTPPRRASLPPRTSQWVAPEHVDDDEADAHLRAVVLRHVDPRVAEDLLPLLSDATARDDLLAALAPAVPPATMAQMVTYRALAATTRAMQLDVARQALALDDENLDARVLVAALREGGEGDVEHQERLEDLDAAIDAARRAGPSTPSPDALEPVFARTRAAGLARALALRSRLLLAHGRAAEARRDAEEAARLAPMEPAPAVAAAAALLLDGDGRGARRWLAGVEGEDVDGAASWGLVLAWLLEGDVERARDHLALARREAPNVEARLLAASSVGAAVDPGGGADWADPGGGVPLAWARHEEARAWLRAQGEPIEDALAEGFAFAAPLPEDADGRLDEDVAEAYGEALIRRFLLSDEARAHLARGGSTALVQWALLDSLAHLDRTPAEWTADDLDELLLRQVPAHLDLAPGDARRGIEAMVEFLRYLGRAQAFERAAALEAHLDEAFRARFEEACRGGSS